LVATCHAGIHRADVLYQIARDGAFLGFRPIKRDAKRGATRAAGGAIGVKNFYGVSQFIENLKKYRVDNTKCRRRAHQTFEQTLG
jgi:hypothetical protein